MKVATIILNWNNYPLTRECVASFGTTITPDHEVIVVDNNSPNGATARIQEEFPAYTYVYNKKNLGIAGGNNIGVRYAMARGAEYVFLCNNDIVIGAPDTVSRMVSYMDAHPEVGILGPRLVYPDGRAQASAKPVPTIWNQFYFDWFFLRRMLRRLGVRSQPFDRDRIQDVGFLMGAAFLVRVRMLAQIGLQDERFFVGYEDIDLCKRAWDALWHVRYFPQVTIVHVHGATSRHLVSTENFDYYFGERLRFFAKHHALPTVACFRMLVSAGAMLRAIWGSRHLIVSRTDEHKRYVRSYARLSWRIWALPWRKKTWEVPWSPPEAASVKL